MLSTITAPTRPVLRYHGGKWKIAPWIISHFPEHGVYVEPFGGAASVLLRKPRSYSEVYNDLDRTVVNVFRVLRDSAMATALQRSLEITPFSREEYEAAYEPTDDPIESARRMIFRSVAGIGTDSVITRRGFRNSTKRNDQHISVAYEWQSFPQQVRIFTERLRGVIIENRNYSEVIKQHDGKDTLFYVDPPYTHGSRTGNARYSHEMTDENHRELSRLLHSVKGMVIVSGYQSDLYDELYADWRLERHDAFAHGALKRVECLWLSPRARNQQQQISFG